MTLYHTGREEVNCLIDLMEPEFSQPMLFQQTDGATQDPVFDPAQVVGVQSSMPRMSVPLALKDVRFPESSALGLSNAYEYKCLLAYLKVNSKDKDRPLIPFGVSGHLYWMFLIQVVICTELALVISNSTAVYPYLDFQWVQLVVCKSSVIHTGRKSI